ncbi:MAG TPA: anhydro-N-acetylmuramic acid kinase [Acidobacteriaceae bacterium]|jgi:anhydro-N-acetylmuramic acid kinase
MLVAGIMSGTSADGIDVALCRISVARPRPRIELVRHRAFPYPATLRKAVLAAMDARNTSAAELARLNWRLGEAYGDAVQAAAQGYALDLVGCHGQTIYHQGIAKPYAGRSIACTWQLGEPALIAAAAHALVVSNFRPADMVAGGHGAPLVPLLDATLFAHPRRARVLQNLGGIANLTLVPPGGALDRLIAFDTGPANMVIDALTQQLFGKPYDRGGRLAAAGTPNEAVLSTLLRDSYYRQRPPKSAGREQYGASFVERLLSLAKRHRVSSHDTLATATALTSRSIALAWRLFLAPHLGSASVDYILAGGGARNQTLMRMLAADLAPFHCRIQTTDDLGIPSEAKEAVAFALLAWHTWHRLPGNVPAATGASHPAILGQITYV